MSSSSNGHRPLFQKRTAPPPSATMSMLESMLDETKKKKKKPRKKPKKRRLEEESNTASLENISCPTKGLEDAAPTTLPKKTSFTVTQPLKPKTTKRATSLRPGKNAGMKPRAASAPKTVTKEPFPLTLNIGRGKKRIRDRSTSSRGSTASSTSVAAVDSLPALSSSNDDAPTNKSVGLQSKADVVSFDSAIQKEPTKERLSLDDSQCSFQKSQWAPRELSYGSKGEPLTTKKSNASTTKAPELSKRKVNNDNFVRLNMKNSAGACRGARNKSSKFKRFDKNNRPAKKKKMLQSGVDPLDDFMDGVYNKAKTSPSSSKAPQCARHQRPCKLLVVKKNTTGNKGRKFYVCSLPRGEQCDHFEWADNTVEVSYS